MAAGEQPTCGSCDRTRMPPTGYEAGDLVQFLDLGMGWDVALDALGWRGTQDELVAIAHRVALIRAERGQRH